MLDPRMAQLIRNAYVRRVQGHRPPMDDSAIEELMQSMPMPPTRLIENALAERMHLHEYERMRQVAELMVAKHLLPNP